MSERDSQHGDRDVDWDADARRAAAAPYPYTEKSFFNYFKDLVNPNDRVLEVGCQIASWIWAWRGMEPTVRYEGVDWSLPALTIARERYGGIGEHVKAIGMGFTKKLTENMYSTEMLYEPFDIEKKIIGNPAVFHHVDAREMSFKDEFDIVFTHTFFQHTNLETKQIVAPRVAKALKPGGLLIIQENTSSDSTWGWMKQGWIDFFSAYGFKLVRDHDIGGGGTGFVFKNPGAPEHRWEKYYSLSPGDIYVEAGAFWCRYGRIASTRVGPSGKVILIEPSPINISVIKKIIKSEGLNNVTLVEKAVWSDRRRMNFRCTGNPTAHRVVWIGKKDVTKVDADSVDNILEELGIDHVDLFAADVEGAEVEMVKGMKRLLSQKKIKNVAIAAYHKHPDGYYAEISEALKKERYKILDVWGGVVYARVGL